jgi:gamma-glutamylcyclotransferase (GGCT)/AIG2-like uncharacterized protein YtfP
MKHLLFTYGTLQTDMRNNKPFMDGQRLICKALCEGELFNVNRPQYPVLIEGKELIRGELWEIDDVSLKRIDRLETYNPETPEQNNYTREVCDVITKNGKVMAFVYKYKRVVMEGPNYTKIKHGDYKLYLKQNEALR